MRTIISILAALVAFLAVYLIVVSLWPAEEGSVVVMSEPAGAQVWVDLEPTNVVTNGMVSKLSHGQHSVTVKLDTLLAEPFALVVDIRRGKPDTLRFALRNPHSEPMVQAAGQQADSTSNVSPVNTLPEFENIPTAAEVRGSPILSDTSRQAPGQTVLTQPVPADSAGRNSTIPWIPPEDSTTVMMPRRPSDTGVISISSTQPGATIFVNDRQLDKRTPANISVPFGTYTIRAELEGYTSAPDEQAVRISRAAAAQSIHFTLDKVKPEARAITVETVPVEGRIFVDSVFTGEGKATVERDFGAHVVTFGDVEGWRKPDPIRLTLIPSQPSESVTGKYVRLFHASAEVTGDGVVARDGVEGWTSGIIFAGGELQESSAFGPKFVAIPDAKNKFGWELGMGDPNRNPTGGDYVAFTFKLPEDVPPETPLNLHLYVYKSNRRYPFSLVSHAQMMVDLNGKRFLDGFSPQFTTAAADQDRYEEWSLHNALKTGENQIVVYTGNGNTVFDYLWKMEIE